MKIDYYFDFCSVLEKNWTGNCAKKIMDHLLRATLFYGHLKVIFVEKYLKQLAKMTVTITTSRKEAQKSCSFILDAFA